MRRKSYQRPTRKALNNSGNPWTSAMSAVEQVDLKEVQRQLAKVVDPEIGMPIVEMNLIDKLEVKEGNVVIEYHATTPYCPPIFALKISQDMKNYASGVKGVKNVSVTVKGHYLADAVNKQVNKAPAQPPQPQQAQPTPK